MTLRGLIIGIAVWLPATVFAGTSWSESQPPKRVKPATGWYDTGSGYSYDYSYPYGTSTYSPGTDYYGFSPDTFTSYSPDDYNAEIKKSAELLKSEAERQASGPFIDELQTKSSLEVFRLKLAPDVCQQIACRALSPDTARKYIEQFEVLRVAQDRQNTTQRSAAAAERSAAAAESNTHIAEAALGFSFLSLLISFLAYWRMSRSTKSAMPA